MKHTPLPVQVVNAPAPKALAQALAPTLRTILASKWTADTPPHVRSSFGKPAT